MVGHPRLKPESPAFRRGEYVNKDYYIKDGSIAAKIEAAKDAGVLFRARDRKHFLSATIDFANKKLLVLRVDGKKVTKLLEKGVALSKDWLALKVVFCGREIAVWLDGKRIATIKDMHPIRGGVGVVAFGDAKAKFDDIVISSVLQFRKKRSVNGSQRL